MTYGHAERTLAAIRLLEEETAELLARQPQLDAEQRAWLHEITAAGRVLAVPETTQRASRGGSDV
jgi:hypothetical protein